MVAVGNYPHDGGHTFSALEILNHFLAKYEFEGKNTSNKVANPSKLQRSAQVSGHTFDPPDSFSPLVYIMWPPLYLLRGSFTLSQVAAHGSSLPIQCQP